MTATSDPRPPRVFAPDDPALVVVPIDETVEAATADQDTADTKAHRPAMFAPRHTIGWAGLFVSALTGLAGLAASLSFARFVSVALERDDWVGWTATGLALLAALAGAVIIARELLGLARLTRLSRLRRDVEKALLTKDLKLEQRAVQALTALFAGRRDLKWGLARLSEHARDVRDPGELLRLADRELMAPLDEAARRTVLASAKRVSVVTALSPIMWLAMLYVLVENLRLLKRLGAIYGGRPGTLGALRLARMVIGHIIATGGLAMTDDLLGQFLGQDLLRRLSRRLGEGAFNGALTARVGTAAIEVSRALPFLDATPVRVRDLMPELFRSLREKKTLA